MTKLKLYVLDWEDLEQTSEVLMEAVKYDYRSNDIKYVNLAELIERLGDISNSQTVTEFIKSFYDLLFELTLAIPGSE